ncbi:MAG TPA: DUF4198 domain-containing protein [Mucilaginibacter sp.]|nr:DUF4198 domain-containing protein [Mucilaginibacter sp.]
MKHACLFLLCLFCLTVAASAQDYALIPENFYPHKGRAVKVHLMDLNQFRKKFEIGFDPAKTEKFELHVGRRKIDLLATVKDTVASVPFENDGLNLLELVRKPVTDDIDVDDFIALLDEEGLTEFSEKAKNGSKDSFREKYIWYLKSLIRVDKHSPNDFDKPLGEDYEIVLKDNPYKGNYGDDITGLVLFKGEPVVAAPLIIYIKTAGGDVFAQKYSTDKSGQFYFKLTREGIYLIRSLHMIPAKDHNVDYDTWMTTYTFAFTSANEMPNSYKDFGFGNIH